MTIKISQLGTLGTIQGNAILPIVSNISGSASTYQANITQLQNYIVANGVSANITALYANASTQSDLIIGINANVILANTGIKGYVDLANTIQSAQLVTTNTAITDANIGIKGYVDLANTIQSAQLVTTNTAITNANIGIKGYVDAQDTAGNVYASSLVSTANTSLKSYVDGQITAANTGSYSNTKVATYMQSYTGAINTVNFAANLVNVYSPLAVGFQSAIQFANVVIAGTNDANGYVQLNVQNINTFGNLVSADFIATAPDGTDSTKYIDMGINGNNFSLSSWTISGKNDGYVYVNSGNITIGTDTPGTTTKIHAGGTLSANVVATFAANGTTISGNLTVANVYVPTANNSVGTRGQITYDGSYVYVCVGTNSWRRANLAIW